MCTCSLDKGVTSLPSGHNDGNWSTPAARPDSIDGSKSKIISEHRPQILHNVRWIGGPSLVLGEIPIEIAIFLVLGCVGRYWWAHFFSRADNIEWNWCRRYCFLSSLRNKDSLWVMFQSGHMNTSIRDVIYENNTTKHLLCRHLSYRTLLVHSDKYDKC